MKKRILLTTTSFQDTPGSHHTLMESQDWDIQHERGPLTEEKMLELAGDFDAFICGDDAITAAVIDQSLPRLQCISKYGIGLDKIDLAHATAKNLPVCNTPGVNHTTVAEHAIGFMLSLAKKIHSNASEVEDGKWITGWKKPVGNELLGKTLGIIGMGRIGKEVAIRARAFGMKIIAYNRTFDTDFAQQHDIHQAQNAAQVIATADILSLHCALTPETKHLINSDTIATMKKGALIINCARGEVIHNQDVAHALHTGQLAGYAADVTDPEPPPADHVLLQAPNTLITAHIASRTYESVQRQATRALDNLINFFKNDPNIIIANDISL